MGAGRGLHRQGGRARRSPAASAAAHASRARRRTLDKILRSHLASVSSLAKPCCPSAAFSARKLPSAWSAQASEASAAWLPPQASTNSSSTGLRLLRRAACLGVGLPRGVRRAGRRLLHQLHSVLLILLLALRGVERHARGARARWRRRAGTLCALCEGKGGGADAERLVKGGWLRSMQTLCGGRPGLPNCPHSQAPQLTLAAAVA